MNIKNNITKSFIFVALMAFTLTAISATGHHSTRISTHRHNSAGTTSIFLANHTSHICYLARVKLGAIGGNAESALCQVRITGASWFLDASLGATSNADAECSALCFNN